MRVAAQCLDLQAVVAELGACLVGALAAVAGVRLGAAFPVEVVAVVAEADS